MSETLPINYYELNQTEGVGTVAWLLIRRASADKLTKECIHYQAQYLYENMTVIDM